jgi:hypothetical protein
MRRFVLAAAAVAALSVPVATIAVSASSSPAFAASSLTCKKLTGNLSSTVTISKCSPLTKQEKAGYKSASGASASLATGGTITWSNSNTTTTISQPTVTSPGQGRCKKNNTEEDATGTVTGGTAAVTNAGDTFAADVCVNNSTGAITLVKGTTATL